MNETAVATVVSVALTSAGEHLGVLGSTAGSADRAALRDAAYPPQYHSSLNNTQHDMGYIDLGIVTNTGWFSTQWVQVL